MSAETGVGPAIASGSQTVADTVHDERFLAGIRGELLVVVVTDQQVGAETHAFPADEHQKEVRGQHERQHGKHEEVQVREIAAVTRVVPHVADGIDVDEEPDERDEGDHQSRERIETKRHVDEPFPERSRDLSGRLIDPERDPPPERQNVVGARRERRDPDVEDRAEREDARERDACGTDDRVERLPLRLGLEVDVGVGMPRREA